MFLLDLYNDIIGAVRAIFLLLDSIGLTFIDNAYNLLISSISAFDGEAISKIANDIAKNAYIIVGIFALFRIAIILVNAIISPDKLSDGKTGMPKVLANLLITIVLLVATPMLFTMSRDLQAQIINNNYISQLIIGTNLNDNSNAGSYMKDVAVRSIIYPDKAFAKLNSDTGMYSYENMNDCDKDCKNAVDAWNSNVDITILEENIGVYSKVNGKNEYVYHYIPFITLLIGGFITYVLLSFTIDIAVRSVELVVLEILSPLFIVTYIDPKSSTSGPFKKWLTTCVKTYASLFIKITVVCFMLFFISHLQDLWGAGKDSTGLLKLLMIIAILIFAKKAPKWLGNMFGVEDGLGGLGIGKKLGGMALAGGAIAKGMEAGKKRLKGYSKRKVENAANTLASKAGARRAASNNLSGQGLSYAQKLKAKGVASQAAGAAAAARHKASDPKLFGSVRDAYDAAASASDPNYKNARDKKVGNLTAEADLKLKKAIAAGAMLSQDAYQALKKKNSDNKAAGVLTASGEAEIDANTGDRIKVEGPKGKPVYLNPQGDKELNESTNNAVTEEAAYTQLGENLKKAKNYNIASDGKVCDSNNNVVANSLAELGAQNLSYEGKLAVKQLVANNVAKDVANYKESKDQHAAALSAYTEQVGSYNQAVANFQSNPDVKSAQTVVDSYNESVARRENAKADYLKAKNSQDYISLMSQTFNSLTEQEKSRLESYNVHIKECEQIVNDTNTEINNKNAEFQTASAAIKEKREEYGLDRMAESAAITKKNVEEWGAEVQGYEEKFSTTTTVAYDDSGKIKLDDNGNPKTENPYIVTIDGVELDPVKNYTKISAQISELQTKAQKASGKFKDRLEEIENSSKPSGDKK